VVFTFDSLDLGEHCTAVLRTVSAAARITSARSFLSFGSQPAK
jgi:hypothetical protein